MASKTPCRLIRRHRARRLVFGNSGPIIEYWSSVTVDGWRPLFIPCPEERGEDGVHRCRSEQPVGINRFIDRRPVFATGNSDGDLQMLQWTTFNDGPRFAMIVHHTDAEREFAYDREVPVGKLDKASDEAPSRGWTVVDIKSDWQTVYPVAKP